VKWVRRCQSKRSAPSDSGLGSLGFVSLQLTCSEIRVHAATAFVRSERTRGRLRMAHKRTFSYSKEPTKRVTSQQGNKFFDTPLCHTSLQANSQYPCCIKLNLIYQPTVSNLCTVMNEIHPTLQCQFTLPQQVLHRVQ
jgi:hypothetical protein